MTDLRKRHDKQTPSPPPPSSSSGIGTFTRADNAPVVTKLTRSQLLFAAIKPPMYTVAVSPALVGSLAAYADTGRFDMSTLCTFLYSFIAIIAWTNLTNDVFDFDTGVDEHKAESIVNIFGGSRRVRHVILWLANFILVTGLYALGALATKDFTMLGLIMIAVVLGYMYQGPPFRLSYVGVGEPICFTAWTLGVCAAYYSQLIAANNDFHQQLLDRFPVVSQRIVYVLTEMLFDSRRTLMAAALLVAYSVTLILFCSHLHQEEDDRKAGKKSPIVRLGVVRATKVLWVLLAGLVVIHLALLVTGLLPSQAFLLVCCSAAHLLRIGQFVQMHHKNPKVVFKAKYFVVKFNMVHCTLLSIGFAIVGSKVST